LLGICLADLQPTFGRRLDDDDDDTDSSSTTATTVPSSTNKTVKATTTKKSDDDDNSSNDDDSSETKKEEEEEDEEAKAAKDAEALKKANEDLQTNFKNKLDTSENFNKDKLSESMGDADDDAKTIAVAKLIKNGPIIELLEPQARDFDNTPVKGKAKNCEVSDGST
jgi:hypothetical protein